MIINNDLLRQLPERPPWQPQKLDFSRRLKVVHLLQDLANFLSQRCQEAHAAGDHSGFNRLYGELQKVVQVISDHLGQVGKG